MRARLLPILAVAAAVAWGPPPNPIRSVEVKDAGSEVVISIHAGEHPMFTSFPTDDPPGFIIDVSDSQFEGVPEDLPGAGGIVARIRALSYGGANSPERLARVKIEFTVPVEPPEIELVADAIVVRVAKPPAERPAAESSQDASKSVAGAGSAAEEASKK